MSFVYEICAILFDMQTEARLISDKVRGIAAEKRLTYSDLAGILGVTRGTVNSRMNGVTPFTGPELWRLAIATQLPVDRFFPDLRDEAVAGTRRGGLALTG